MPSSLVTYESIAKKMIGDLKEIQRLKEDMLSMTSRNPKGDQRHLKSLLTAAKQRTNGSIRAAHHLHRTLYLIDKKIPGSCQEHLTPIDLGWVYALSIFNYVEEHIAINMLANILKEYIFVRVIVSYEDNLLINKSYKNSKHKMPEGWRFGDCRFERYLCLGEEKIEILKNQFALLR
jgi:hypothetical protein